MINFRNSVLLKKGLRYSAYLYRPLFLNGLSPPILANAIPKSGTHLLVQILEALPDVRDWANFIASTPSLNLKETKGSTSANRLNTLASGELVGAHLFHSEEARAAIKERSILHYLIYRDPRDIIVSEVNYLTKMNRWHRLHKTFRGFENINDGYRYSIVGEPNQSKFYYPNIAERFARYEPWISDPSVVALKFEDLRGPEALIWVRHIVKAHWSANAESYDLEVAVLKCYKNIDPKRSHTFSQGRSGGWKNAFDKELKDLFKDVAGDLLIRLGYEKDHKW
ncbi:MAG: sulfotransferase domain-containing protein [Verrucomicrobiota bacterium]|nr:sulfotransferase domain-containing protein [Verrucomicrobiota bacterium]